MLQKMAAACARWSTRWVPDSWVIAVILALVTYLVPRWLTYEKLRAMVAGTKLVRKELEGR